MNSILGIAFGLMGMGSMLSAPSIALAQSKRMALTCVGTKVGAINFSYRWGEDGDWTNVQIGPGKWQVMAWRYNRQNENQSPQLQIRYDDDLGKGENFSVTDLESYAASSDDCDAEGKTYHFVEIDGELFVEDDET